VVYIFLISPVKFSITPHSLHTPFHKLDMDLHPPTLSTHCMALPRYCPDVELRRRCALDVFTTSIPRHEGASGDENFQPSAERQGRGKAADAGNQSRNLGWLVTRTGEEVLSGGLGAFYEGPVRVPCTACGELSRSQRYASSSSLFSFFT